MAGGGTPTPTKGGKRSVDFTVNLVPTIDLLSVLISFLLITAVWTQLARINASQVLPKTSDKPAEDTEQEEIKKLYVFVSPDNISINLTKEPPTVLTKDQGDLLEQFRTTVKTYKERIPNPAEPGKQQVIVAAGDGVEYSQLISVMDVMLDNGLSSMSIGDANVVKGQMPEEPALPGAVPGAVPAPPAPATQPG